MLCFLIHWPANHWRNIYDLLMPSQFTMILLWNFEALRMALKERKSETVEWENTVLSQTSYVLPWWAEKWVCSLLPRFWFSFQVQNWFFFPLLVLQNTRTTKNDKSYTVLRVLFFISTLPRCFKSKLLNDIQLPCHWRIFLPCINSLHYESVSAYAST